ncbi:DUF2285 domain-containing protein [Enterobacter asburiae]|nr:DUF2285 domain-containing protein [Enterobacter asburiae]
MYIDIAWECLKRNQDYIKDWSNLSKGGNKEEMCKKWGILHPINPENGCVTEVFWDSRISSRSINIKISTKGLFNTSFLLSNKNLFYKKITLNNEISCIKAYNKFDYFQFFIETGDLKLINKNTFICIHLEQDLIKTLKRLDTFLKQNNSDNKKIENKMHFLNMYDKSISGLSHRKIAYDLYENEIKHTNWDSDSWIRARVRYTLKKAKEMINGGYQCFL